MQNVLYYFIAVSVIGAVVCIYDKLAAARGWKRVPERTLFFWALVGGGPGVTEGGAGVGGAVVHKEDSHVSLHECRRNRKFKRIKCIVHRDDDIDHRMASPPKTQICNHSLFRQRLWLQPPRLCIHRAHQQAEPIEHWRTRR